MNVLLSLVLVLPVALAYGPRIVGGDLAKPGQFPHQVSIQIDGDHICGGALIGSNTILTTAHCVLGYNGQVEILAGVWNLKDSGIRLPVISFKFHEYYNPLTFHNDIAILKVKGHFPLGGLIQAIRIRSHPIKPDEFLTLSGWGLSTPAGDLSMDLKRINLRTIDFQSCSADLTGGYPIFEGQICTSAPIGQGACQGDTGGPLIDQNGALIGLASWDIVCAKGLPDVFTSVPYHMEWIRANV